MWWILDMSKACTVSPNCASCEGGSVPQLSKLIVLELCTYIDTMCWLGVTVEGNSPPGGLQSVINWFMLPQKRVIYWYLAPKVNELLLGSALKDQLLLVSAAPTVNTLPTAEVNWFHFESLLRKNFPQLVTSLWKTPTYIHPLLNI